MESESATERLIESLKPPKEPPPLPYDARVLEALQERHEWQLRQEAAARYEVCRDSFQWFGPAMLEAGYLDGENDKTSRLWKKADAEWGILTGTPALGRDNSWQLAGVAAGYSAAEVGSVPWKRLVETIKLWAKSKAELQRAGMPGKTEPAGTGKAKRATVAARMIDLVKDIATHEWTARKFAAKLGCSPSSIVKTGAWIALSTKREEARQERSERAYHKNRGVHK